jgi:hypothetical protein
MATWQPTTTVQTRTDRDGTTYQLTHNGRTVRVRFHRDGTIRFASAIKGEVWQEEPGGRPSDRTVTREHGYPVVRVRPVN